MKISGQIHEELKKLASFSDTPPPSVTRVVFSSVDLKARAYVKDLCAAAGLNVREHAVGNTFARWIGSEPQLPAVGTGSHIDAIPHAGAYDGTVGVLGGLEAIRALQREGVRPRRSIELLLFTSEEPTPGSPRSSALRAFSSGSKDQPYAPKRLSHYEPELRGPAQNRWGGQQTQRLRTYGGKFGAANEGRSLSANELERWKRENGL
jgi:hypothetical protein